MVNQWRWLEESGHWLENVDRTHLVLASGNQVLQKHLFSRVFVSIHLGDRHPDEPDDLDDGSATPHHHRAAKNDERPGGQARDGADAAEHEHAEPGDWKSPTNDWVESLERS